MPSGALRIEMLMIPERPSNMSVVEACTLFNSLEPEQKAKIAAESFMAYAERGEAIWTAGSPSDFVAVSGAGFIKMTRASATGQEIAMELLGPGQCFGLMAAIEGRSFPLSATAVSNCWYLKIPTKVLLPIYQASGHLKDLVVRNIGPRLRKAHDMMTRLSSGRVEERIAAILLILADSYGTRTPAGIELGVPLTRQDISEMAGTTVETTIRVLSKWQKEGLIKTHRQLITIQNEEAVEEILRSV